MHYVEVPNDYSHAPRPWVFLAGGITDCPDWQQELRKLLEGDDIPGTMLNPRRANFPIHDPNAAQEQITWEFHALNAVDVFSMWFSAGSSVQPICMYELGRHLARWETSRQLVSQVCIGVEPGYLREQDVFIQAGLILQYMPGGDEFEFSATLRDHADQIKKACQALV